MLAPIAFLLLAGAWTAQGNGVPVDRSRNCLDLYMQGKLYEGNYIVYPEVSNNATIIYCSREDGMVANPPSSRALPRNCAELQESGNNIIYPYQNNPTHPIIVECDQERDGGGYTVIQKRYDGSVNFYRTWSEYAEGFGYTDGEHYLGNDNIAALTGQTINELLVELEDWTGATRYAHYDLFIVKDSSYNYRMSADYYYGTAGDELYKIDGSSFTTYNSDHDSNDITNCASWLHGAWWYSGCGDSSLNGRYYQGGNTNGEHDGIQWSLWHGYFYSMKSVSMKVRPHSGHTKAESKTPQ